MKVGLLYGCTRQKNIDYIENGSNENCTKLNFVQKTQWKHVSVYSSSGGRAPKICVFEIL